jgi:hypothetical protein
MALVRLSDVIVPEVFFSYMTKDTTEKTNIFTSGIMAPDAELAAKLSGGGEIFQSPFWNDLDSTESSVVNDDTASTITPGKISASRDKARRQIRARAWSTADLAGVMAGSDPMQRILGRVTNYWDRQFQTTLVNTLTGVFADNAANDSSDMIQDISNDLSTTATAAELVSAEAIIDAAHTLGDNHTVINTIIMHSNVEKRLKKLNLIDFEKDSTGQMTIPTYLGYRVIVDDGVRKVVGSNRTKYWSYLCGPGVVRWAEVAVPTPVEVDRAPEQGNGMGVEILYTRRQFVMHPAGFAWQESSVAGEFPTNSELALAANWNRCYEQRKQIPLAALVTNG